MENETATIDTPGTRRHLRRVAEMAGQTIMGRPLVLVLGNIRGGAELEPLLYYFTHGDKCESFDAFLGQYAGGITAIVAINAALDPKNRQLNFAFNIRKYDGTKATDFEIDAAIENFLDHWTDGIGPAEMLPDPHEDD